LFADKLTPHKLLLATEFIGGNCQGRPCPFQIRRSCLGCGYQVPCIELEQQIALIHTLTGIDVTTLNATRNLKGLRDFMPAS
jgi:hypothetical protein